MIDVIIADNTRAASGDALMNLYSAGGVVASLAQKRLDVRLVDLMTASNSRKPAVLRENLPADIYCYSVFFGNKEKAFSHMENARRLVKAPRFIIAFGPFAAEFPDEILSRGLADMVVDHDPEFVIPAVLQGDDASWESIPNLSFRREGRIIHTQKKSFHNLDEISFISPYLYHQGYRPAFMMAARGCQHHCVYCDRNALWGGGVRNRSVNNVLSEIKELVENQQVKEIRFLDEDLAADHHRLVEICKGMRQIKGEFTWQCCACIDSVNQKMLLLMGSSGCRNIFFGMESASTQVLRRIGKTYDRQDILNAVRWAKEAGLKTEVMITTGNPGETDIDRKLTVSTLKELGPGVNIVPNRLVILPGTAFYRKGLQKGWYTKQSFFEDDGVVFYDEKE